MALEIAQVRQFQQRWHSKEPKYVDFKGDGAHARGKMISKAMAPSIAQVRLEVQHPEVSNVSMIQHLEVYTKSEIIAPSPAPGV